MEEWITVLEAASLSGYHPEYMRELIRSQRVKARKFGPLWQVSRSSLLEFLKEVKKSGDKRRGPKPFKVL
jgi:excisionase family DNA binding protein